MQLLDFARGYCATATLWVPEETLLDARCSAALAALKPLLLKTERAPAGTIGRPVGGPTLLHTYQYDLGLVRRLQRLATRLYAWKLPLLPADLHLWRADGRPWLVSSGQEASGAVLLTLGEEHAVARALPGLHLRWDPLAAIAS